LEGHAGTVWGREPSTDSPDAAVGIEQQVPSRDQRTSINHVAGGTVKLKRDEESRQKY